MTVARTARRRRKQAAMGFRHLAKLGRPIYRKTSEDKLARREQEQRERLKMLNARKGAKKR